MNVDTNVEFIVANNDTIWIRDYGPNCVYFNEVDSLYFFDWIYTFSANGTDIINARALALKDVERIKEASVDYYAAVRNAYQHRRAALVHDRKGMSAEEQQDLYNVEDNGGE